MMSQIESSRGTQYTPLYEKGKFECKSSQWRLLGVKVKRETIFSNSLSFPQLTFKLFSLSSDIFLNFDTLQGKDSGSNFLSYSFCFLEPELQLPDWMDKDPSGNE